MSMEIAKLKVSNTACTDISKIFDLIYYYSLESRKEIQSKSKFTAFFICLLY